MANRKSDDSSCRRTISYTSGEAYKSSYSGEWKIENFRMLKSSKDLLSEQQLNFVLGESDGYPTNWICGMATHPEKDSIGVYVRLVKAPPKFRAIVNYCLVTMKPNGLTYQAGVEKEQEFIAGGRWHGFKIFDEAEEELGKVLWEDGSIVIKLTLELCLFKPAVQPNTLNVQEEINRLEKGEIQYLTDIRRSIIELDREPDWGKIIKIVSNDRVEFYANTATLSARSQVFESMFRDSNWKECQGSSRGKVSSLVLDDFSGKTVKVLLYFLLGGVLLKQDWEAEDVILEIINASHKYKLHRLTEFLDKVLPAITFSREILAKLVLLTKRLGMRNAENGLFLKLKETATDVEQLLFDKEDNVNGRSLFSFVC